MMAATDQRLSDAELDKIEAHHLDWWLSQVCYELRIARAALVPIVTAVARITNAGRVARAALPND